MGDWGVDQLYENSLFIEPVDIYALVVMIDWWMIRSVPG